MCKCPEPETAGRSCACTLKLLYWFLSEVRLKKHWPSRCSKLHWDSDNLSGLHEVSPQESSGTWTQSQVLQPGRSSLSTQLCPARPSWRLLAFCSLSVDLRGFHPQMFSSADHRIKSMFFSVIFEVFYSLDHVPFKTCLLTSLPCSLQFSYISRPAPETIPQPLSPWSASSVQSCSSLKVQA